MTLAARALPVTPLSGLPHHTLHAHQKMAKSARENQDDKVVRWITQEENKGQPATLYQLARSRLCGAQTVKAAEAVVERLEAAGRILRKLGGRNDSFVLRVV